jgi:hypothetical protein
MRGSSDLDARDVERLFAGRASVDDPDLGDLARFFADLERAYPTVSMEAWAAFHVDAMAEAAERRVADVRAVPRPRDDARGLMSLSGGRRAVGRGNATRDFPASVLARVVAFAAVLAMIFGGVAFADALPSPLRDFFASFAERAGISVDWGAEETTGDGHGKQAGAPASQHDPGGGAQAQKPGKVDGAGNGKGTDKADKGEVHGKADQAGGSTGEANGKADQAGGSTGEANGKADQAGGTSGQSSGNVAKDDDKH